MKKVIVFKKLIDAEDAVKKILADPLSNPNKLKKISINQRQSSNYYWIDVPPDFTSLQSARDWRLELLS
jgi:hypothetical protein